MGVLSDAHVAKLQGLVIVGKTGRHPIEPPECDSDLTLIRRGGPPSEMAPRLVHALLPRRESAPSRAVMLGDAPVRIGRAPQNDLVLASPEISREHCTIRLEGERPVVTDLRSTNGVYVDGIRVDGTLSLSSGARVMLGPYTLHYVRGTAEHVAELQAREHEEARAVGYIQSLLPAPLRHGFVEADWLFVPSARLGGDAFGYGWIDDARFSVFLLDVSGHGLGSALLAVSAANMLRARGLAAFNPAEPAAVLSALNAAFQMDDHNGLFFSVWYGVYDRTSRSLRYASAGHHPAYLAAEGQLQPLATRAPAIGMAASPRFTAVKRVLGPGDRLHLFSDGAFEVTMADGRAGSVSDLLALLHPSSGPDEVYRAMRELTGRRPFEDDVSLLTLVFP